MKKFILPLIVAMCSQMIAPAMAQTNEQITPNAGLMIGREWDIWPDHNTASDWEEARRICDGRIKFYSFTLGNDTSRVIFEPEFFEKCARVEVHFYEAGIKKNTEKLNSDLKKLDDLFSKDAAK